MSLSNKSRLTRLAKSRSADGTRSAGQRWNLQRANTVRSPLGRGPVRFDTQILILAFAETDSEEEQEDKAPSPSFDQKLPLRRNRRVPLSLARLSLAHPRTQTDPAC